MRTAMGLVLALALGGVVGASGCAASGGSGDIKGPDMAIKDVQVIWTRGGKLGYLDTYDVSERNQTAVTLHYVEDLDFRKMGWIADDGQGERFAYPESRLGEAKRTVFERVPLPKDALENQIRRILQVDPKTEIKLQRASVADLHR